MDKVSPKICSNLKRRLLDLIPANTHEPMRICDRPFEARQVEIRLKIINTNNLRAMVDVLILWLPFRSSSLCDSNASSICALACASFGELRSACASMAHDSRSHSCKNKKKRRREVADRFCGLSWEQSRGCLLCLDAVAGGIILCSRFPGDGEID